MRRLIAYVLMATAAAGIVGTATTAGAASYTPSSYASRLLELTNQARAEHGLPALQYASGTSTVAASWTSQMASSRALSHNPNLANDLASHGSPNWTDIGENVGEGNATDPDALFQAYMASPEHRANILHSGYRYMGVGVVFTGKTAWNTFDFVDQYGSSSGSTTQAAKPAPKPTHATAPAPRPAPVSAPAPAATSAAPAQPATVSAASSHRATAPSRHASAPQPGRVHTVDADPVPAYFWNHPAHAAAATRALPVGAGLTGDGRRPVVLVIALGALLIAAGSWLLAPRRTA